jgi:hypothetical protein
LVLLGIENFEFILITFTGKNDYYDVLEMTIFNPSHLSKWLPSSQKER